jgi:hypothetical protein
MKIRYICDCCEEPIGELVMDVIDDERLGFHCLTEEERKDIIKIDDLNNIMTVTSLCDGCIQMLGLEEEGVFIPRGNTLLN